MTKGFCKAALAVLVVAACGRDGAITEPVAPNAPALQPGVLALGVDSTTGASIETNKDDYSPGEVVHLVGRGWAPGETVNLHMVEEPNTHADVDTNVVADASGGFSIHFYDVQTHDLGVTFTLTASGQTSGSVAVATFTDGNIKFTTSPANVLASVTYDQFNSSATCGGSPTSAGNTLAYGAGHGLVTGRSMRVFVPSAAGYTYTGYSNPDGLTITPASSSAATTLCISGTAPGTFQEFVLNFTAAPTNAPPTADAGGPYSGTEGSDIALDGTGSSDSDGSIVTYAWTYQVVTADAGASCSITNASSASASITCTDDGSYTVTLTVTDDDGAADDETVSLTVSNANPVVTINSPTAGSLFSLLNGAISVNASYTDAGSNDTHTCQLVLDGAIDVTGSYFGVTGGTCSGSILPSEAGVYNLIVRVKDDDDGVGSASVMIVVYDPSAGFVTGGGWITSPGGAYVPEPSLSGKATFGFVSKYKRGATIPEGNTEFQFHAGGMNFHSSTYQWLVVNQAGSNAQFKGTGTINGAGSYTFMLWATDGGNTGDTFRIQITDNNNGDAVVYDNGVDQPINSGSIVIHTGGKK